MKQLYNLSGWLEKYFTQLKDLSRDISKSIDEHQIFHDLKPKQYQNIQKMCNEIVQTKTSEDIPAPETAGVTIDQKQEKAKLLDSENQRLSPEENTACFQSFRKIFFQSSTRARNSEAEIELKEMEVDILTILRFCKKKSKKHLDDSEQGSLAFENMTNDIKNFKDGQYTKLEKASKTKFLKKQINEVVKNFSYDYEHTNEMLQLLLRFEKNTKLHDQAFIYIDEIGKWCERIKNKANRILQKKDPEKKKCKSFAGLKNHITVNRLGGSKTHMYNSSKTTQA